MTTLSCFMGYVNGFLLVIYVLFLCPFICVFFMVCKPIIDSILVFQMDEILIFMAFFL